MTDAAEAGAEVIVAAGFLQQPALEKAAAAYPCLLYTAFVEVRDGKPRHLGGIGIGGGTITGLSKLMLNTNDAKKIRELASGGEVGNIDPVSYTHLDVYKRQA